MLEMSNLEVTRALVWCAPRVRATEVPQPLSSGWHRRCTRLKQASKPNERRWEVENRIYKASVFRLAVCGGDVRGKGE